MTHAQAAEIYKQAAVRQAQIRAELDAENERQHLREALAQMLVVGIAAAAFLSGFWILGSNPF